MGEKKESQGTITKNLVFVSKKERGKKALKKCTERLIITKLLKTKNKSSGEHPEKNYLNVRGKNCYNVGSFIIRNHGGQK